MPCKSGKSQASSQNDKTNKAGNNVIRFKSNEIINTNNKIKSGGLNINVAQPLVMYIHNVRNEIILSSSV